MFIHGNDNFLNEIQGWPLADLLPAEPPRFPSSMSGRYQWQSTTLGRSALPLQLELSNRSSERFWESLPSFTSLGSIGSLKLGAQVLAEASLNEERTPLLITQFAGAGRVGLQCTDETFLWTSASGSDVYHQRYWGQMLRWLSRGKLAQSTGRINNCCRA